VSAVALLGPDGRPLPPATPRATPGPPRPQALNGGRGNYGGAPYDAADIYGQHMAAWTPGLYSADGELNPYRDRIVSRVRDMVRNDGWASGAVTRIVDNAVGPNLRPLSKPDYRYLAHYTGNAAFDAVWAKEFGRAVDANWRTWANDEQLYCDAARNQTFGQLMRTAFRHKIVDGDALAIMLWLPRRVGKGRARYATTVQLVDPDRLSNPQQLFDSATMRGGVEIEEDTQAAVAYHIRKAHMGDWWSAAKSVTWERVPRETKWGRHIVVHDFDGDRATQHRGGAGIFAPVLQRLKMLAKYDGVELDAAVINAIFAAYVESPFDPELVKDALSDGEEINAYQQGRSEFHDQAPLMLGGARIPVVYPGEEIKAIAPARPNGNFAAFEGAVLRNVASGLGLSDQQVSNNYGSVNYSSARAALLEAWKTLNRRRDDFSHSFAGPVRTSWLEESMAVDDLPLPRGVVPEDFAECRGAYSRCRWLGPPMGWVDPVAERTGVLLGMDAALGTLEEACAEQGLDYEEVLEQRAAEIHMFKELGIPVPEWGGQVAAAAVAKKPEAQ
jgi:lambda family phage portal protein